MSTSSLATSVVLERTIPGIAVLCAAAFFLRLGLNAQLRPMEGWIFGRSESAIRHIGLGLGLLLGSLLALLMVALPNPILSSAEGLHPSLIALSELAAALLVAILVTKQNTHLNHDPADRKRQLAMAAVVGALAALLAIGGWPCQTQ